MSGQMTRRSNDAIDAEVAVVKAQLEILQRREDEFQKLIVDMQKVKFSISDERTTLEAKERSLEEERHHIYWLPIELLTQIFVAFVELGGGRGGDTAHPFHQPPVTISHVCKRWRAISLATPSLWSRLWLQTAELAPPHFLAFLERSHTAPLDLFCYGARDKSATRDTTADVEHQRMLGLVRELYSHITRLRSITVRSRSAQAMEYIIGILGSDTHTFPLLRSLNLTFQSDITLHPGRSTKEPKNNATSIPTWSNLKHLRLEKISLFCVPTHFLANLISLELNFRMTMAAGWRSRNSLRMKSFCDFLTLMPLLEDLVLTDTVPILDTLVVNDASLEIAHIAPIRVTLNHLKNFDWSFPYSDDVYEVFTFLHLPALEKLDLWVEQPSNIRVCRSTNTTSSQTTSVIELPALRDLSLQCADEDSIGSVLRKFSFPALEKVEITNTDERVRLAGANSTATLPTLPRLESIFRDPRLPHLTHLTLSHFEISPEPGRAEAMLGYMPFLTSLSLDTCTGVGKLLEALHEKALGTIKEAAAPAASGIGGSRRRRGVKVCPRLEALSLWGCNDANFEAVREVVQARNRRSADGDLDDDGQCIDRDERPNKAGGVGAGSVVAGNAHGDVVMGRKIRPLRKLRLLGNKLPDVTSTTAASIVPSAHILSSMIAMEEAFRPAHVVYVRIEDCNSVSEMDARSLSDLGVVDIVWGVSNSRRI